MCLELPDPDLMMCFPLNLPSFFCVNQLVLSYYTYQEKKIHFLIIHKVITFAVILPTC